MNYERIFATYETEKVFWELISTAETREGFILYQNKNSFEHLDESHKIVIFADFDADKVNNALKIHKFRRLVVSPEYANTGRTLSEQRVRDVFRDITYMKNNTASYYMSSEDPFKSQKERMANP